MLRYDTLGSQILASRAMTVLSEFSFGNRWRIGTLEDVTIISRCSRGNWDGEVFFSTENTTRITTELRRLLHGGLFGDLEGGRVEVREGFDWFMAQAHMPRAELSIQMQNIRWHLFDWAAEIQRTSGLELSFNGRCELTADYDTAVRLLQELEHVVAPPP